MHRRYTRLYDDAQEQGREPERKSANRAGNPNTVATMQRTRRRLSQKDRHRKPKRNGGHATRTAGLQAAARHMCTRYFYSLDLTVGSATRLNSLTPDPSPTTQQRTQFSTHHARIPITLRSVSETPISALLNTNLTRPHSSLSLSILHLSIFRTRHCPHVPLSARPGRTTPPPALFTPTPTDVCFSSRRSSHPSPAFLYCLTERRPSSGTCPAWRRPP